MAHFIGKVTGQSEKAASRIGSKRSGLVTYTASWRGAVRVAMTHNPEDGLDYVNVMLVPWHGKGTARLLYYGPVDMYPVPDLTKLVLGDDE